MSIFGRSKKTKKTESAPQAVNHSANLSSASSIPEEIIAVISAAVAAMSDQDKTSYRITSVKRVPGTVMRPAWSMAGIMENTRSFF